MLKVSNIPSKMTAEGNN